MRQDDIDPQALARKREEQEKLKVDRLVEDVKWLMAERIGRRLMFGLLEESGVFVGSFTGDAVTFFNEGKRAIGLKYLSIVNGNCPDQFVTMLKEHQEDVSVDRSRRPRR